MSDVHVLESSGGRYRLALHIPIPNTNNSVGVNYRTALVNSGLGGVTALTEGIGPGHIATAEKTQIEAGELIEEIYSFQLASTPSNQLLDDIFNEQKAETQARLEYELRFFGHTRDVP